MKVCLYTDSDIIAGTETHLLDLARGLSRIGIEITVICPASSPLRPRLENARVHFLPLPKRGSLDLKAGYYLKQLLQGGAVDLIHAHNGRCSSHAALAVKLANRGAFLYTQHFLHPAHTDRSGLGQILSKRAHTWVNRSARAIIAIGEEVKKAALKRGDAPAAKIHVVHNGIEDPPIELRLTQNDARRQLELSPEAFAVFCAARLEKEKDIHVLLAAMKEVAGEAPRAHCYIAGSGKLAKALKEQIASLGLTDQLTLLGRRDDVPTWMRACDVFVLPSAAEPFGLVLLEAMAMERPVVACDSGGPREIVEHGRTGLLVPPESPTAIAHALSQLLQAPDSAQAMGMAGRKRFLKNFTAEKMVRETLKVYEEVMGRGAMVE